VKSEAAGVLFEFPLKNVKVIYSRIEYSTLLKDIKWCIAETIEILK